MRRVAGPASLDVPDELLDKTSYVFEARIPAQDPAEEPVKADRILVAWEALSTSVTPDDMVAHRRARIEEFEGATSVITEAKIQGAFVEASALQADVVAGSEQFTVLFAAFRWSPELMGSISAEVTTRKDLPAAFGHIVESVRPASFQQAAAPGYVQRFASDIALDLPVGFRWPRTHLFVTDDEAARLMITSDDAEPEPIDFYAFVEVEGLGDDLHVDELKSQERALPLGGRGEETSFRVERRDGSGAVLDAKIIRRVVSPTKDRAWLSILLFEDATDPSIGEERWEALLQSLAPSGQIP